MIEREGIRTSLFKYIEYLFRDHLLVKNNSRIIFSGRFGQGKTTFIREFFKEDNQKLYFTKKEYNIISLYPVNYSVASNEDIFRYIKHDIILEMLKNNSQIEREIIEYFQTLPEYLSKNFDKVLAAIVYMIPKVGKDIVGIYEKLNSLKEEYLKFHDDKNYKLDIGGQLIDYIEKYKNTEGNIFENDIITRIIEHVLNNIKSKEAYSENVLIIDDLDRIDPEHIFRILNIFSAHFDRNHSSPNKFGFDKIIIVCDIKNLRNIFRAKYGVETDFNGYIDKFYSHKIFEFNNRNEIYSLAKEILSQAEWSLAEYGGKYHNSLDHLRNKFDSNNTFLPDILLLLVENGQLQLRNILKYVDIPIHVVPYIEILGDVFGVYESPLLLSLKILIDIKGDAAGLRKALEECYRPVALHNTGDYIQEIVSHLTYKQYLGHKELDFEYKLPNGPIELSKRGDNIKITRGFRYSQEDLIYVIIKYIELFENMIQRK